MKRALLLALAFTVSLSAAPNPVTTVILVRHAEKVSSDDDSPLTPAGTERANELARVFAGVKLDAIYTTQWRRVRDTAAPIAQATGLTAIVRNTGERYAADLANEVLTQHRGQTVLVVGHSNTTVSVMKALGATNVNAIADSEYDNLYVLTDVDGATPKVLALRFGNVAH
ncbi:MAG TPA: histidine phosphatase family protein [Thermoanaerobaculia bacterium]|nr:histidine phosphatase family protein [Thermoanaerobaculia bacterium]